MASSDWVEMSSASSSAAVMARVFATTSAALARSLTPASASAMARAEAVRFSICELAAASDRSSSAANGAISPPICSSNRATSVAASSTEASVDPVNVRLWSAMRGTTAAEYGPRWRRRCACETTSYASPGTQSTSSVVTTGH